MQRKDPWKPLFENCKQQERERWKNWYNNNQAILTVQKSDKNPHVVVPNQSGFDFSVWHEKGIFWRIFSFYPWNYIGPQWQKTQFFKISSFYIPQKKSIRVWNKMRVTKFSHFWVNAHLRFMLLSFNRFITVWSFKIVEKEIKQVRKTRQKRIKTGQISGMKKADHVHRNTASKLRK